MECAWVMGKRIPYKWLDAVLAGLGEFFTHSSHEIWLKRVGTSLLFLSVLSCDVCSSFSSSEGGNSPNPSPEVDVAMLLVLPAEL